ARRLKADPELRSIPLVAVTALAMVGDRDRALAAGFDGYLPKPIVPETFVGQALAFLGAIRPAAKAPKAPVKRGAAAARQSPAPRPRKRSGKILVVDDSCVNIELIRSTLEPVGSTMQAA